MNTGIMRLTLSLTALFAMLIAPFSVSASIVDLDALQRAAAATGWRTARSVDGSLLLFPRTGQPEAMASRVIPKPQPAFLPLAALEKRLVETGWTVRRDSDQSLLLYPRHPARAAIPAQAAAVSTSPAAAMPQTGTQGDPLVEALRARGWAHVERASDGSLLFFPRSQGTLAATTESSPQPRIALGFGCTETIGQAALDRLDQVLRERGWRTARGADGSLLLFVGKV